MRNQISRYLAAGIAVALVVGIAIVFVPGSARATGSLLNGIMYSEAGGPGLGGSSGATTTSIGPAGLTIYLNKIYFTDPENNIIRKLDPASGALSNYAGTGIAGYGGDGGAATTANLSDPQGIASNTSITVFADANNNVVREINRSTGDISTIAGNGSAGYSGDGGAATSAELNDPEGVAIDSSGNIYIADTGNNVIRKVSTSGVITTYAGNGTAGYSGDSGIATSAEIHGPEGISATSSGLLIADTQNSVIRETYTSGSAINIETVAGTGTAGYSGDGGLATSATLNEPADMAVDSSGNIYIADTQNDVIRKVTISTGYITTSAGNGTQGFTGDGGAATSAELNDPTGVVCSTSAVL